jgi:hypothetical protein
MLAEFAYDESPDEAEDAADAAMWRPSSTRRDFNLEEPFFSSQELRRLPAGDIVSDSSSRENMEPELSHAFLSHEFACHEFSAWSEGKSNESDESSSHTLSLELLLLIESPAVHILCEILAKVMSLGRHELFTLGLPRKPQRACQSANRARKRAQERQRKTE